MLSRRLLTVAALICSPAFASAGNYVLKFKIVDPDNKPVRGAVLSDSWTSRGGETKPSHPNQSAKTELNGTASLFMNDWGFNTATCIYILSADQKLAAFVNASKADDGKELSVTLKPAVMLTAKFTGSELKEPHNVSTYVCPVDAKFMGVIASGPIELPVPPGKYKLWIRPLTSNLEEINETITIAANQPVFDLGNIELKSSPIAGLIGKPAPPLKFTDVRNASAKIQLADYKGKWVYLEFWGYWCSPCVGSAMPPLIELYDTHAAHRNKFEIIAIHDSRAKSFEVLDPLLAETKKSYWQNKDLPFPVLIDGAGDIEKAYCVQKHPTGYLIDPDGNLVGEATHWDLAAKLPRVSADKIWAQSRDRYQHYIWTLGPEQFTYKQFPTMIIPYAGLDITLDKEALKAAGLTPDSPLVGAVFGSDISLRSLDELLLAPLGLGIAATADDKKLVITKATPKKEAPSYLQKLHAEELNNRLDQKPSDDKAFIVDGFSIMKTVQRLNEEFQLPIALDAAAIRSGKIDPKHVVFGTIDSGRLRKSLTDMLDPLGLTFDVRSEVIFITPKK